VSRSRKKVHAPSPFGFDAAAFTRCASEGWWAVQGSNL
jgi:hypothetical protein